MKLNKIYNEDCLDGMKRIPDKSIDMILCDLPYGTTACKWDIIIPFEPLWEQYKRIIKDNGIVALFGSEPFSSKLRNSNIEMFRYDWIWEKEQGTNQLLSKVQPLRIHENISIFYLDKSEVTGRSEKFKNLRDYFYTEKTKTNLSQKEFNTLLGNNMASHYFTKGIQFTIPTEENYKKLQTTGHFKRKYNEIRKEYDELAKDCKFTYNPQMAVGKSYTMKRNKKVEYNPITDNYTKGTDTINKGERYPTTILKFNRELKNRFHPTQKPVSLVEYLIKTYTNDGETVLDNCMGSGTTAIACLNTDRQYIGFELDKGYFEAANKRIKEHLESTI